MRKNVFGRNLKRDTKERKALFRGLMSSLVLEERIKTTEQKAKSIKGQVEKLVTKAKHGGTHVETMLSPHLNAQAIKKVIEDIAPRFSTRPGGYTRIIRLEKRFNDNASLVLIEWVEKGKALTATQISDKKTKSATKVQATAKTSKEEKTVKPKKPARKVAKK